MKQQKDGDPITMMAILRGAPTAAKTATSTGKDIYYWIKNAKSNPKVCHKLGEHIKQVQSCLSYINDVKPPNVPFAVAVCEIGKIFKKHSAFAEKFSNQSRFMQLIFANCNKKKLDKFDQELIKYKDRLSFVMQTYTVDRLNNMGRQQNIKKFSELLEMDEEAIDGFKWLMAIEPQITTEVPSYIPQPQYRQVAYFMCMP